MEGSWLYLSAALAVGIPALATGWAQSRIGPAAAATLAEKPELTVTVVLLIAIPETVAIHNSERQDHGLDTILDRKLIEIASPALDDKKTDRPVCLS